MSRQGKALKLLKKSMQATDAGAKHEAQRLVREALRALHGERGAR